MRREVGAVTRLDMIGAYVQRSEVVNEGLCSLMGLDRKAEARMMPLADPDARRR